MDPKLLLLLKVLDLATMGYGAYLQNQPKLEALKAKVQAWVDSKTDPTAEDFAALDKSIDDELADLKAKVNKT